MTCFSALMSATPRPSWEPSGGPGSPRGGGYGRIGDEYGHLIKDLLRSADLDRGSLEGIAISCVVPPARQALVEMSRSGFGIEPVVIGPGIKTGMSILYDNPREVGADRIANTVAAYEQFNRSLIVIDFGTAITFDVVSGSGDYLGGVIFPGIHGYGGLVDALVQKIAEEMLETPYVVATGGMTPVLAGESRTIQEVLPNLTLEGLRILYDRNR